MNWLLNWAVSPGEKADQADGTWKANLLSVTVLNSPAAVSGDAFFSWPHAETADRSAMQTTPDPMTVIMFLSEVICFIELCVFARIRTAGEAG